MRTLRETTEQQIAAELEAVRRAREAAINAMSEVCIDDPTFSLAHTSQTLPPMSLKRKRDDSEVEDVSGPASSAIAIVPVHSPQTRQSCVRRNSNDGHSCAWSGGCLERVGVQLR